MKTSRTDATGSRDRRQPADDETTSGAAPRTTLSENARTVLAARYLRRDRRGDVTETPEQMFTRVARAVAAAEERFAGGPERRRYEERFLDALLRLDFLPNSPTLMNAGTPLGQLSACFVLPIEDSMDRIFDSLKLMALVQQSGGGTGFSFSRLRPRGTQVASTGGEASGPVSFLRIFDAATENIRQGGRRRGANMAVLAVDHPDIVEFVDAKCEGATLRNFNLSVAAGDAFFQAALADQALVLQDPRTGQPVRSVSAAGLLRRISQAAWRTGDPGLIFVDAVNRANPTPQLGLIEATNPCGEVPLLPYEACNLGSLNLAHLVRTAGASAQVAWDALAEITRLAVRFLDDVVEVSHWPSPEIDTMVRQQRRTGVESGRGRNPRRPRALCEVRPRRVPPIIGGSPTLLARSNRGQEWDSRTAAVLRARRAHVAIGSRSGCSQSTS